MLTQQHDVPDQSSITLSVDITLMTLSSIFVIVRLYVRKFISNNLGLDDCAAVISLAFLAVYVAMELDEVKHGLGRHKADVDRTDMFVFLNLISMYTLVLFNAIFFTRLAILLFIRRLLTIWKSSTILWLAVAVLTTQHLIFFFAFLLQCRPIRGLWNSEIPRVCIHVSDSRLIVILQTGVGILCDFALFAVPVVFMWRTLSTGSMRFRVTILLGFGLFACVAGIIRLFRIVRTDISPDPTWLMVPAGYWTQLECHTGLIVSCFPAVNQIFRHWISEGDGSAQNNGVASWVLRRAIPGMNSIDTMSTDQGMDSRTVGRPEGLEGGVVEALPGGDGAVPVKCGGLWERDYS